MPNSQRTVSPALLAANRANAAKSTGPRSPEGKARSAQNARKHGFTGSTYAVVRLEDVQEIANLKEDLTALYQPENSQELFALERIAVCQQALLRAARLESGLFTTCLNLCLDSRDNPLIMMDTDLVVDIEVMRAQNRNFLMAEGFHRMTQKANGWTLFLRYQAQTERNYRRAVEDFERIKALRKDLPNEPVSEAQPEQTETTSTPDETNPSSPEAPAPGLASRLAPDNERNLDALPGPGAGPRQLAKAES